MGTHPQRVKMLEGRNQDTNDIFSVQFTDTFTSGMEMPRGQPDISSTHAEKSLSEDKRNLYTFVERSRSVMARLKSY
jgi:hypothetical protein